MKYENKTLAAGGKLLDKRNNDNEWKIKLVKKEQGRIREGG